ncbi:hypothetical protein TRIUR3_19938 [Triticum urartu]|uniref:Uncharacterized protein n=1 Tax=Triticum urartu TaxID=4572 RepID=M7Z4K1_TRIUA|nr:hypothetical protein TRIUR3_19938 [Triticum urartu]
MSCLVVLALLLATTVEAQECRRSGTLRPGKGHSCEDCCEAGKAYPTYRCSPPVVAGATRAIMTLNDFDEGGDGGDPSACDEVFHRNSERVVALSTGWSTRADKLGVDEFADVPPLIL